MSWGWDQAWEITSQTFNYTNHTCCRKRLNVGRYPYLPACCPVTLEIIYEINSRFLKVVRDRFAAMRAK